MDKNKKMILAIVTLLFALSALVYLTLMRPVDNDQITNSNLNTNITPTPSPTPNPTPSIEPLTNGEVYNNTNLKFAFTFPKGIFTKDDAAVYTPFRNRELIKPTSAFKHEIKTEYCALSGQCRPTTIDMSFGAAIIPQSMQAIKEANPTFLTTKNKYGEVQAEEYAEGAEGEGMAYYFFTLSNGNTLMMYQRNISEQVVTRYQTVPEFIKIDEQNRIMGQIIASLKIQ